MDQFSSFRADPILSRKKRVNNFLQKFVVFFFKKIFFVCVYFDFRSKNHFWSEQTKYFVKRFGFSKLFAGIPWARYYMIFLNNFLKLGRTLVKTKQKQNFLPIPTVYRKNDTNFFSVTIIRIKCKWLRLLRIQIWML